MIGFEPVDMHSNFPIRRRELKDDVGVSFELDDAVRSRKLRGQLGVSLCKIGVLQQDQLVPDEAVGCGSTIEVLLSSGCSLLVVFLSNFSGFTEPLDHVFRR